MTCKILLCVCCVCVSACGQKTTNTAIDSTGAATGPTTRSASVAENSASTGGPSATKQICPASGKWALCSVEKRLKQSGFVVIPDSASPTPRSGFSVKPTVYKLGRGRLEVFLYGDASTANRDASGLDTTKAAPRGGSNSWETTPLFVRSANLLAVFLTDDPRQAERLSLALTAGAPQPAGVTTLKPSISTPSSPR